VKFKILNGILIIDILSILLILSIVFIPSTAVRVILGLPFLIFFPGYVLVAALFAKREGRDIVETVALSCGMSIAVVALIGFGLNYTPWGIRLDPVLYSIAGFIIVMSAIALTRRARISKTNRFTTEFSLSIPDWGGSTFNKSLSIILIIAICATLGVLGYTVASPKIGERYTEFYILGIKGKAQDYPTEFTMANGKVTRVTYGGRIVDTTGGSGTLTVGIVNHEQQPAVYSVVVIVFDDQPVNVDLGGTIIEVLGPVDLQQGEKWEKQIEIVPRHTGDNEKLEFRLLKGDNATPENTLHLWVNVKATQ